MVRGTVKWFKNEKGYAYIEIIGISGNNGLRCRCRGRSAQGQPDVRTICRRVPVGGKQKAVLHP